MNSPAALAVVAKVHGQLALVRWYEVLPDSQLCKLEKLVGMTVLHWATMTRGGAVADHSDVIDACWILSPVLLQYNPLRPNRPHLFGNHSVRR